ncbi:transmembrane protein 266 isoform X4 [Pseudopipra pipra]|uniref:transmembrane protein 266 isoform X4 n=1 Tax=Pseudopipra pipra TaxID=415032 RepID=UPI0031391BEE
MTNPQPTIEGGVSEVEIISQQVEEETKSIAPVQLVNFAYRDLPLAALDLSVAGSQLLSNLDEEYQREGFKCFTVCRSNSLDQPSHPLCFLFRAYVLPVKVEMEMMIQQYEKAKVIQDEQLERLTQICQEQGFEIRQLRAHLAQQDLDLAAEREAALQVPHVLNKQSSKRYKVVATDDSDDEATENITELRPPREDDMNNYISRYYNEPSTDSGVPEAAICVVTTAAIDVHRPNISSELFTVEVPLRLGSTGTSASITSGSASRSTVSSGTQACSESSHTLGSSPDCSTACEEPAQAAPAPARQRVAHAVVQELLSSLSEEACLAQKGLDPVNLKLPSPAGSVGASPDLGHRLSVYNRRNQESLDVFQLKPLIDCPPSTPMIEEKYGALGPPEPRLGRVPEA